MAGVILAGASLLGPIIIGVVLLLLIIIVVSNVVIVPQASAFIVERLGAYQSTWETGLHIKIPMIERIANKVTLKERVADFPPQPVITKDNVTMRIDTVVYFQVTDPKLFTYGIVHPMAAIENLTATTLRNIIGELELDQTLTSRDVINTKMRSILDEATDPWGIKINRVELKNIDPPPAITDAMERQMKAERERREAILRAEGEKKSAILIAEGEKEAVVLRAEAARQQKIKEAEGEAEALLRVQTAMADSIRLLNEANPIEAVVKLKALEAFSRAADGKATKIIVPSEIQSLAGLATSLKEVFKDDKQ
ncbi:MAG: paraslipin [Clostridia bacterium]|nr:paraslipin [Clostridia bacterium]